MSAFRAAVRTLLESSLRCPKCPAVNRPGATYIEMDDASDRAYCTVCACSGPTEAFSVQVAQPSRLGGGRGADGNG